MSDSNETDGPQGNASGLALLIIDMVTDFEFHDGAKLFQRALPAAKAIAELKRKAKLADVPVLYVNDNYGKWQEDFGEQAARIERTSYHGGRIIKLLKPEKDDFYVLKPHRSGFYETPLRVLLESLGVKELILTGVTTDMSILFTANDAYMRKFTVRVPGDCTAASDDETHRLAIEFIERVIKADISPSTEIQFEPAAGGRTASQTG